MAPALASPIFDDHWQAVKRAGWKGFFWAPDLVPARRMSPLTRDAINYAGQWLYDNIGFAGSLVDRVSIYEAGSGMWPKATSSNPRFNTAMTDLFHQGVKDPRFFDMAKVETYYSAQFSIRQHIRLYGGHFGQLVRGAVPRMRFIPDYQVKNPPATRTFDPVKEGWQDGCKLDEWNAVTSYCVWTSLDGSTWAEIPADDLLHFHDHFLSGQLRGMSIFARAAEKLFTIDDIIRAHANGLLSRARMGYALTVPSEEISGPSYQLPGAEGAPEKVTNPDGSSYEISRIRFPGGDTMDVPVLPPGYEIKTVESQRPSTNEMAFIAELKRDCAHSAGYTPEFMDAIIDSGGAVTRFVMEDAQMVIDDKRLNQLEPQFAHRFYIFSAWQRIKAGQFDAIEGGVPDDWWRYRMIYPARKTVDKKNDGRLDDSRLETGKMSPEQYHGQVGDDAEDVEDEVIAARERREEKVAQLNQRRAAQGLPPLAYEDVFRPPAGSAPAAAPEPEPEPEPPVPPKPKV